MTAAATPKTTPRKARRSKFSMIRCLATVVTRIFAASDLPFLCPCSYSLSSQHFLPFHIPQTLVFVFRYYRFDPKKSILPTSSSRLPNLLHPSSLHTTLGLIL